MFIRKIFAAAALAAMAMPSALSAQAAEPYIGEIIIVPYTFCPRNYAEANGQLLAIQQNTALFALLGTTYGGNGQTTFGLPDLRGRTILHQGTGPGLSSYSMGQASGFPTSTLTTLTMPAHSHTAAMRADGVNAANLNDPGGNTIARALKNIYTTTDPNVDMRAGDITLAATGGGQPFSIMSPYLAMRHCIALVGVFPPRS